jgi:hypothetical protein
VTDTPTTNTSPAIPTIAQRAPRWIAYVVVGLVLVWIFVVADPHSVSDATIIVAMAVTCGAWVVANLADTLSVRVKLALGVGGGLLGVAIFWASHEYMSQHQIENGLARSFFAVLPSFIAVTAASLVARWIGRPKRD